jgi:D-arabinonate dehydratase
VKIVAVRTIPLQYRGERLERDALAVRFGAEHPMDVLLTEVVTDEGIVGVGEHYAYAALKTVSAAVHELVEPLIVGEDPTQIGRLWEKVYNVNFRLGRRGLLMCALSGVDIALWDILGQVTGRPVASLLGQWRRTVPAYVTGGYYQEGKGFEELRAELEDIVRRGFFGIKLKIGGDERAVDLRRLELVREVAGRHFFFGVDANNALTYPEALRWGRDLEALGIDFFEEPVSTDQPELSARLAAALDVPIAGYETETGLYGMREFIVRGGVDIVQTDAIWVGGLTEARRVAELGRAFGLPFIPHYSAGAVALVANLHLAAAMPHALYQELHLRTNPLRDELLEQPLQVENGHLVVPDGPGLGIRLNPDTVARYRVDR